MYMQTVTITAVAEGITSDSILLFPRAKDPANTPIVMPSRAKKTAIRTDESGETVNSPVR